MLDLIIYIRLSLLHVPTVNSLGDMLLGRGHENAVVNRVPTPVPTKGTQFRRFSKRGDKGVKTCPQRNYAMLRRVVTH